MRKRPLSRGFTLVELLMAVVVGMVLLGAIWSAVIAGQKSSVGIERKITTGQDARSALEIMAAEIRMASFNPRFARGMWIDPANCSLAANQSWRGIQEASAAVVTIEMDLEPDGRCGNSGNEIIRYAYDKPSGRITRETIRCASGIRTSSGAQPFLGPIPSNPAVRTVRVINGEVPLFRYYDGKGAEVVNLPAEIPRIRRIEIVLVAESVDADPRTGESRRTAFSTSVTPRNHGVQF
ncbi:prepilin-type N-terminal cleavage/methylation domain-containing protein [bacterium]|nr:prepilin-type N-terminal cleavage/methylation domain-containing protein [bacterium]